MTALYSKMYAHSGYRTATGELAPDWDAPRNWEAPYWRERYESALIAAGDQLASRLTDAQTDALLDKFWAAFPDAWLEAQPARYLALDAEALFHYLLRLPAGAQPDVETMIQVYKTRQQPA